MIRGERFELDVGSDDEQDGSRVAVALPSSFVRDVLEREPSAPKAPSVPTLHRKNGFPEHPKRELQSRFKRQQKDLSSNSRKTLSDGQGQKVSSTPKITTPSDGIGGGEQTSWEAAEKVRIDEENKQKLAQMSPEEIEEERRELMNSLSPGLLQRLLQRSNIESGSSEAEPSSFLLNHDNSDNKDSSGSHQKVRSVESTETVRFEEPESKANASSINDDVEEPSDDRLTHDGVHFPELSQPPDLDPSSNSFFDDLHQKYFPSLPSEPQKLEWMQSSTPSKMSYDPSANTFNAGEIRFSFKGELIPPKTASEIPVTAGLHHHGDAPDAAGYTIAELAHLARSTYPAQRSIAFQTLGRILYRLSKGEFGDPGEPGQDQPGSEDTFGELSRGLWREVERTKVIDTLVVESEGNGVDGGRHASAKAYATEAVWLWQRGGGRKWKAG